ncbi:MAG: anti-sigma factor family protein [Lachnospirales bacterium]
MNCNCASELMMKYMDGTLQQDEGIELKKHLSSCNKCKEEFAIFEDMLKNFDNMEEDFTVLDQDFNDDIMACVYKIGYIKKPSLISKIGFFIGSASIIALSTIFLLITYMKESPVLFEKLQNTFVMNIYEVFNNATLVISKFTLNFKNIDFSIFGKIYILFIVIALVYGGLVYFKNFHIYYEYKKQKSE